MLFEREQLTPVGRLKVMNSLFAQIAAKEGAESEAWHVPHEVLYAYGELNAHVRYIMESVGGARSAALRKAEKLLDALPESIMTSLHAGPEENWLCMYRQLVVLYEQMEEIGVEVDEDDYVSILQKMLRLVEHVSAAGRVEVNAASMFTLLLMQVHLHRHSPVRRRAVRRRTKSRRKSKRTGSTRSSR